MRRVKTREELEKEFGLNWRDNVRVTWCDEDDMDYLLGTLLTPEQEAVIEREEELQVTDSYGRDWTISLDVTVKADGTELSYHIKSLLQRYTAEQILDALLLLTREQE